MESVEIEIFGKRYRMKGNDPQKIKQYAAYLNKRLDEINSKFDIIDQKKMFVLTSLVIVEELFDLKDEHMDLKKKIKELNIILKKYT